METKKEGDVEKDKFCPICNSCISTMKPEGILVYSCHNRDCKKSKGWHKYPIEKEDERVCGNCNARECEYRGRVVKVSFEELENNIHSGKYTLAPCGHAVNLHKPIIHKLKNILKEKGTGKVDPKPESGKSLCPRCKQMVIGGGMGSHNCIEPYDKPKIAVETPMTTTLESKPESGEVEGEVGMAIDNELYENCCYVRSCLSGSRNEATEADIVKIAKAFIQMKNNYENKLLKCEQSAVERERGKINKKIKEFILKAKNPYNPGSEKDKYFAFGHFRDVAIEALK